MAKTISLFDRWFRAQFGKRPHDGLPIHVLKERLWAAENAVTHAQVALRERLDWEARRDAALKAWTAAQDQHPEAWTPRRATGAMSPAGRVKE